VLALAWPGDCSKIRFSKLYATIKLFDGKLCHS